MSDELITKSETLKVMSSAIACCCCPGYLHKAGRVGKDLQAIMLLVARYPY